MLGRRVGKVVVTGVVSTVRTYPTSLSAIDCQMGRHVAMKCTIERYDGNHNRDVNVLLRSQLNAKISLSFQRDSENDQSKLRILVDSRLENQRIQRYTDVS